MNKALQFLRVFLVLFFIFCPIFSFSSTLASKNLKYLRRSLFKDLKTLAESQQPISDGSTFKFVITEYRIENWPDYISLRFGHWDEDNIKDIRDYFATLVFKKRTAEEIAKKNKISDEPAAKFGSLLKEKLKLQSGDSSKKIRWKNYHLEGWPVGVRPGITMIYDFHLVEMRKIFLGLDKINFLPITNKEKRTVTYTDGVRVEINDTNHILEKYNDNESEVVEMILKNSHLPDADSQCFSSVSSTSSIQDLEVIDALFLLNGKELEFSHQQYRSSSSSSDHEYSLQTHSSSLSGVSIISIVQDLELIDALLLLNGNKMEFSQQNHIISNSDSSNLISSSVRKAYPSQLPSSTKRSRSIELRRSEVNKEFRAFFMKQQNCSTFKFNVTDYEIINWPVFVSFKSDEWNEQDLEEISAALPIIKFIEIPINERNNYSFKVELTSKLNSLLREKFNNQIRIFGDPFLTIPWYKYHLKGWPVGVRDPVNRNYFIRSEMQEIYRGIDKIEFVHISKGQERTISYAAVKGENGIAVLNPKKKTRNDYLNGTVNFVDPK